VNYVTAHKNDSPILSWLIGSQVHHHQDCSRFKTILKLIDEIAKAVKGVVTKHQP
jgi:hypothetical protein